MMPYDYYRLYQAERVKSSAEIRFADAQAGKLAAAASQLFRLRPRRPQRLHAGPQRGPGRQHVRASRSG
jgi:hypothetical protein